LQSVGFSSIVVAMSLFDAHDLADLKLVYRVLHAHMMEHAEIMDSAFTTELQKYLQGRARADGVELADHAQWDRWLHNARLF
jgi:hypothetical protein